VKKSHTVKSALEAFVKSIRPRPSLTSSEAVPGDVQRLLQDIQAQVEKAEITGGAALKRAQLLQMVMPSCLKPEDDGKFSPDKQAVKEWAYSLGQLVGFLAGIVLQRDRLDGAIDEIAKEAKQIARRADDIVQLLDQLQDKPEPVMSQAQSRTDASARSEAKAEERKRMIQDLEDQASLEQDPAAKTALQTMANRLKTEADLEAKLEKAQREHVA
jgi:hypothetical protein